MPSIAVICDHGRFIQGRCTQAKTVNSNSIYLVAGRASKWVGAQKRTAPPLSICTCWLSIYSYSSTLAPSPILPYTDTVTNMRRKHAAQSSAATRGERCPPCSCAMRHPKQTQGRLLCTPAGENQGELPSAAEGRTDGAAAGTYNVATGAKWLRQAHTG
eukprot:scaffold6053_cov113-Isochrysis_galbana.AAC.2